MAIKTCDEVINGPSYAGGDGSSGKRVTRDSDAARSDSGDFLDGIIKAAGKVNATANSLYQYDCSAHLLDWIYSVCPQLKTVGNGIDKVVGFMNGITAGDKVGDFIQNNGVTNKICDVVASVFGMVNSWLEMIAKAAFALFDKIDAARESMQAALNSLTDAVLDCILDVYDMIEKYLSGILTLSLNFDWGALELFLMNCPCVCRFIAFVTGCDRDSEGNNISDQPDMVLRCLRDKMWFIDGLNLATGLAAIMDDYIRKYIVIFFDAISLAIDSLFTLFIKPFRYLIKQYANFLRKQWDVSFLVDPLRVSHLDCLLIYHKSTEHGKTVYTMSVLDMMESMKMWVNCLEYPCKALSERIKNRVKKFNEDMRLTGEYWNRAFEADIYQCCMRADADPGYSVDELSGMWSDLYDRLRACNRRAKNHVAVAKVTYGLNGIGGVAWDTDMMQASAFGVTPVDDPVKMASEFSDSNDRENDINVGDYPLTSQEDELMLAIGLSIAAGCDEDSYFVEKWYQFLRFAGFYAMSDKTVSALGDARESPGRVKANFSTGNVTNFPSVQVRPPLTIDETERGVNYWVDSDYDAERIDRIRNVEWPARRDGEPLADYYARAFAKVG